MLNELSDIFFYENVKTLKNIININSDPQLSAKVQHLHSKVTLKVKKLHGQKKAVY